MSEVTVCAPLNKTSPSEVVHWSNHRVMEWLRSVDLAEYAPTLRGSGVHGGLMVTQRDRTEEMEYTILNESRSRTD